MEDLRVKEKIKRKDNLYKLYGLVVKVKKNDEFISGEESD